MSAQTRPETSPYPALYSWPQFVRRAAQRFPLLFEIVLSATTILIAFLFASILPGGRANPVFVFFTVAIAYVTWIAGRRAGVLALVFTAGCAGWFIFIPHNYRPEVLEGLIVRVIANLAIGALTVWVVARLRATESRNLQLIASEQQATRDAESEHQRGLDILESITDAFCALDSQWRFTYVNSRTVQEVKRPASELLGRNIWELFPSDIGVRSQYEQVMHSRKPTTFERYFNATDSWLEVHVYPAPQDGLLIFFHDITERRRKDARLKRFYQSEIFGVMTWNLDGAILDGNDHFLRMIGYSREELNSGQISWRQMTPPEYRALDEHALEELRTKGIDTPYEKEFMRKDGSRVAVLAGAARFEDSSDEGVAFVVDITQLRAAENALRESEQRFRAVAENIPQMIWVATAQTEFKYLSRKWLEYTGTTLEENSNGGWSNALHPEDRARTISKWNEAVARTGIFDAEYRVRRHDGHYRWQLARGVPILGSDIPLWFGTTTDIEDQKKAQVALIRSEKLASVGRMAATVAHEINNPLEAIMNVVYLASVEQSLSDEGKRLLGYAQQELIRVAHITRQTLGFYRESGTPIHVKLPEVVDSVLDLLGPRLKIKGVRVIRDYRPAPPVYAIRGELLQVLSNLVGNAMDALTNGNGSIRLRISPVSTSRSGPAVRLTISDSGCGIPRSSLPHIFEPFFTTKESFGTGLGLWVSKGILEKHRGSIGVRSTPGKGTTFSMVLPTEAAVLERSA
jgi:PAS domain S-box-containing protein